MNVVEVHNQVPLLKCPPHISHDHQNAMCSKGRGSFFFLTGFFGHAAQSEVTLKCTLAPDCVECVLQGNRLHSIHSNVTVSCRVFVVVASPPLGFCSDSVAPTVGSGPCPSKLWIPSESFDFYTVFEHFTAVDL